MSSNKYEKLIEELVMPVIEQNKFELVDVEYKKEGPNWYLRVYIDKSGGITLDDCQVVSEYLSDELDRVDPIEHKYILEVSSPGVDRPLKKDKDFEKFKGRDIDVKLYAPIVGSKELTGKLLRLQDGTLAVEVDGSAINIPRDKIASARLTFKF